MWVYILAGILFLGFFTAVMIGIVVVDKQKTITIYSRLGRRTNLIEIINVNLALLVTAYFVYIRYYIFMPAIVFFVLFIIITTRVQSGMSEQGVFIGMTFIEWDKMKSYKIINDDISTFTLKIRANKRQYVFRCDKSQRVAIEDILLAHGRKKTETI